MPLHSHLIAPGARLFRLGASGYGLRVAIGDCVEDDIKAVEILQQRINRPLTSGCIGAPPLVRSEACPCVPLDLRFELLDRLDDEGGAGALGHDVAGAEDPGGPEVVSLQRRGRGERNGRVDERELVVKVADRREALTHPHHCVVRGAAVHCGHRPNNEGPRQEPWTGLAKQGGCLVQQLFGLPMVTDLHCDRGQSDRGVADAPSDLLRLESINRLSKPLAGRREIAESVCETRG